MLLPIYHKHSLQRVTPRIAVFLSFLDLVIISGSYACLLIVFCRVGVAAAVKAGGW
jgi:hypothetical protein